MANQEETKGANAVVDRFAGVEKILERYDYAEAKLIPILQAVQEELGYLPRDVIAFVASALKLPPARVFGVATFYAHFSLEPKGKYVFRLCDGTACHVKGSEKILDALRDRLQLAKGQETTDDLLFTVETVSCLGACGLAPVMLMNEDVHGSVTPERAVEIIDEVLGTEKEAPVAADA